MSGDVNNSTVQCNENSKDCIIGLPVSKNMGKEDRKKIVLKTLAESGLALTPYVLFVNIRRRGGTFERRTLANYLRELVDEGRIEKLEDEGDTLYVITDEGQQSLEE